MTRSKFVHFVLALICSLSCSSMEQKKMETAYTHDAFLNATLNKMGFEFRPFPEFSGPCLKKIKELAQDKSNPCRILEIGGAYGRFQRFVFSNMEKGNEANIQYDFCELDQRHTKMAQTLFQNKFPKNVRQVTFKASDAVKFLEETQSTYHVIIISNVLHYLS
jgi:hypothetical protein